MARQSACPYNPGMSNRPSVRATVLIVPLLIAALAPAQAQELRPNPPANDGQERIAPAFRAERDFETGAAFLRELTEGTTVSVQRLDGAQFTLTLTGGLLKTSLPASTLSADGSTVTSPLGYKLAFTTQSTGGLQITAPNGQWAIFNSRVAEDDTFVTESDAVQWRHNRIEIGLRLPDGSRVDALDGGTRWEIITLLGERYALTHPAPAPKWETFPRLPSPPLIPDIDTFYLAGDGNDWYKPAFEDHVVFGWDWWPAGLALTRAIEDVSAGFRRRDLNGYFQDLEFVQSGPDMGACLLGRRLALGGGDRLTFQQPGTEPVTAYLFPGSLDPDRFEPKKPKSQIPTLRQNPEKK